MKLNKLLLIAVASLFFASCSDDDNNAVPASGEYANGFFILNQGGFMNGDASVSFLSENMQIENNIFAGVNPGHILGDTGQDIAVMGDYAYIVMNFSSGIVVVNRYNFQYVTTIENGLDNPRYIAFSGGKAYVTNWGDPGVPTDDFVAVINLSNNTVAATIPVAEGPEKIVEANGKLYVAHSGGHNFGNTVTVINSTSNTVATTINVGYVPNSLEAVNGKLYVLSGGVPAWSFTLPETAGNLSIINLADNTVNTVNFTGMIHPLNLDVEEGNIYYTVDSGVYKMPVTATAFPTAPLFTTAAHGAFGVYSFAVKGNHIYLGDAGDFNSAGKVYVYSQTGLLEHSFTVGVIPSVFCFNN